MQILKEEIRENILEAALCLFYQKGYEKTSMAMIAEKTGVSKSNLYNYFRSKEEIFCRLTHTARNDMNRGFNYIIDEMDVTQPRDFLGRIMADKMYPFIIQERREIYILLNTSLDQSSFRGVIKQRLTQAFVKILARSKQSQGFESILAEMLISAVENIVYSTEDDKKIYDNLVALFQYHANGIVAFCRK